MDTKVLVAIVAVVVAVLIIAAVILTRKRRREHLRENFGPEYDRAVAVHGSPARAEAVLADREKRVHSLSIKHLSASDRATYTAEWEAVQRRFVDDPAMAVSEADSLVNRVMTARGYPMGDFEQRAADISVDYPTVVQNYRLARDIAARHSTGQASTEELRQAMVHYRSLFAELLEASKDEAVAYQRAS
jgi:hypothetical protein